MSTSIPGPLIVQGAVIVTGPSGEIRLENDVNGARVTIARNALGVAHGFYLVEPYDPTHYTSLCLDWPTGNFFTIYNSRLDLDMFTAMIQGPQAGLFQVGTQYISYVPGAAPCPPARVNNREVWPEVDSLKSQLSFLQSQITDLKSQLQVLRKPISQQAPGPVSPDSRT